MSCVCFSIRCHDYTHTCAWNGGECCGSLQTIGEGGRVGHTVIVQVTGGEMHPYCVGDGGMSKSLAVSRW